MRKQGTIVRWDEGKGFGFIRNGAGGQDVFLHVRDYRGSACEKPREGLRVTFEDVHVGGKGPRAMAVQPMGGSLAGSAGESHARSPAAARRQSVGGRPPTASRSGPALALVLMATYALGVAWLVWRGQAPWWLLPASALLNLATFCVYSLDKDAARNGRWRIQEETLHFWSLAGGWGGAWLAQRVLRHKSVKTSFQAVYWSTVVIHCAGVVGIWWFFQG